MIREGQFTPEIKDYLNTVGPWKDSPPGYGWMVNQFYNDIYELRRKNIEELRTLPAAKLIKTNQNYAEQVIVVCPFGLAGLSGSCAER